MRMSPSPAVAETSIGMVIALPEEDAAKAVAILEGYGERASVIGRVTDREGVVIK